MTHKLSISVILSKAYVRKTLWRGHSH